MRSWGNWLGGGEKAECFGEWDSEKKESRHQRRDRDGYPDLLSALFDGFDKISVDLGANSASFLGN
jgi:hypothetical protein